jgi:hypothetical protein
MTMRDDSLFDAPRKKTAGEIAGGSSRRRKISK